MAIVNDRDVNAVKDCNIAKAARTPCVALADLLFYISTSGTSRGKTFRLMFTGATTQPHRKGFQALINRILSCA